MVQESQEKTGSDVDSSCLDTSAMELSRQEESTSDPVFSCDSCTIYVVSTKDLTLPTDHNSIEGKVNLKDISSSLSTTTIRNDANVSNYDDNDEMQSVQRCIASRSIVLSEDRRIMYAPLVKRGTQNILKDGKSTLSDTVMAVVVFRYGNDLKDRKSTRLNSSHVD